MSSYDLPQEIQDEGPTEYEQKKYGRRAMVRYSPDLVAEICDRVSEGEVIKHIMADDHLPATPTWYRWMEADPRISNAYTRSIQRRGMGYADEIVEIADNGKANESGKTRVQVDARKFISMKLLPGLYGDQVNVIHSGEIELGAQTLAALAAEGEKKALKIIEQRELEQKAIDAEFEEVD